MWFTIAFFTYPIAFFLTYKAFLNYKPNGLRNLSVACIIFIIPIILLFIERKNLREIESEIEGIYTSGKDTLIIFENNYISKDTIDTRIGKWELNADDNLSIQLTDKKNHSTYLKIGFNDDKVHLTGENSHYLKLK